VRTVDAERINFLVNHPAVRPFIGGDPTTKLDLSAAVADTNNVFVEGKHGGFAFTWSAPCVYEVHTFILPEGRGAWAASFAQEARSYMQRLGARHLWTRVHPDAVNVRSFTLKAGFEPAGTHTIDLGAGPVAYDLFDWRP
jgi:hypothetical protein